MKEIKDIIRAFDEAVAGGRQTALATVVHVDGSSYRRPGARMLVTDDGMMTGAISGGCLEGDALRKALYVMNQQKAMLVTYDTMDDDDAQMGIGLGCNGIIQVLIEPVNAGSPNNPVALLKAVADKRENAVLVTLFCLQHANEEQPGTCLLVSEKEVRHSWTQELPFAATLMQDAEKALGEKETSFKNYNLDEKSVTACIECILPVVSLVIVGAGNDAIPLAGMAGILGWQTTIIDGRPNYAKADRFSSGCRVLVSKPEQALEQLVIDEHTVFVLMTHNYHYDLAMLRVLISKKLRYIGSLGPRKKAERMLAALQADGLAIGEAQVQCLYGPSGLDIGAETPEEIALSIIAEIKAVLAGRQGMSLRNNTHSIHQRNENNIVEVTMNK